MRAIDGDALIEDFKNDRINLFMDGLKGTPRERCIDISNVIERIEDAPTLTENEMCKSCYQIEEVVEILKLLAKAIERNTVNTFYEQGVAAASEVFTIVKEATNKINALCDKKE